MWLVPLQQTAYRTALCLVTLHALATAALGADPQWRGRPRAARAAPVSAPRAEARRPGAAGLRSP
ncbi:hypothetical protein [Streptomyces sp. NPDC001436]